MYAENGTGRNSLPIQLFRIEIGKNETNYKKLEEKHFANIRLSRTRVFLPAGLARGLRARIQTGEPPRDASGE